MAEPTPPGGRPGSRRAAEVVVVTTALLTFIPWWRAAAVVLCDMASTVYYVGGIAERAVGPAAPWFVLAVMSFAAALAMVYIESCGMFVRGGVYRVVKEAMGDAMAKLSASSLMFDYLLTAPISAVSAGQYFVGLLNSVFPQLHIGWTVPTGAGSVVAACLVTLYFWRKNIKGIEESSEQSQHIMILTTVMGVLLLSWSAFTLYVRGFHLPPFTLDLHEESLGWLHGMDWAHSIGAVGVMIAFGHSLLGVSGLETIAQVYREIEAPKLHNLKKAAITIVVYSLLLTGLATLAAAMIIPDAVRVPLYADNLLSGLAMYLEGPLPLRLAFQGFVVLVGVLILSGAVNAAIFGSNSVLNRLAEDGVLTDWFRALHPKYGTTYRMIDMVVALQLLLILCSGGDVYVLGEAYAFGVIWSFVFKTAAVIILRFKRATHSEWKVPGNLKLFGIELPLGLVGIFLVLLSAALVNLFTKKVATVSGVLFTAGFYGLFTISEKLNHARRKSAEGHLEKFNLHMTAGLSKALGKLTHEDRVLVPVRDFGNLYHLKKVLEAIDPDKTDVVVMTSMIAKGLHLEGEHVSSLRNEDQHLFTNVLNLAEKYGCEIHPVLVLSNDPFFAIAQTAQTMGATQVVLGASMKVNPESQLERLAMTFGAVETQQTITVRILWDGKELSFTV